MSSRRRRAATAAAATVLAFGAIGTANAADSLTPREAAGQYYYECVLTNGTSYWLKSGEPTTNCKGSYLHRYINGKLVANIHLTPNGAIATEYHFDPSAECVLGITTTAYAILTANGKVAWVMASLSGVSTLSACISR